MNLEDLEILKDDEDIEESRQLAIFLMGTGKEALSSLILGGIFLYKIRLLDSFVNEVLSPLILSIAHFLKISPTEEDFQKAENKLDAEILKEMLKRGRTE